MTTSPADGHASSPSPAIRARDLSRRFGHRWALREVSLEVKLGETLALFGPNGAGKTTLLRVFATLLRPTLGDAEIFGHSVRRETAAIRARTGLLTATGFLYDDLTALENLRFASLMSGIRPQPAHLETSLARVGLSEAAGMRVRAFSTGMRRRLELARLLLRPLDLVLLDEPFISLDSDGVELVTRVLGKFREAGATVVLASHQHADAYKAADRIALLRNGRLEALETPAEARARLETLATSRR
jgi:heme exporter protein A